MKSNSLNCNKALLTYLKETALEQTTIQCILAYFILWRWNQGLKKNELDAACEYLIQKMFNITVDFDIELTLKSLESKGLIVKQEEKYFVIAPDQAIEHLDEQLLQSAHESFTSIFDL